MKRKYYIKIIFVKFNREFQKVIHLQVSAICNPHLHVSAVCNPHLHVSVICNPLFAFDFRPFSLFATFPFAGVHYLQPPICMCPLFATPPLKILNLYGRPF